MPSKSDQIRGLAQVGMSVSEIAKKLGVSYQFAYQVCRKAGVITLRSSANATSPLAKSPKPQLRVEALRNAGFITAGRWEFGETRLICPANLPRRGGVYAFSLGADVVYVGLASRSLAHRLYFYGNPGVSQRTNIRLNARIREAIGTEAIVEIHYACPPSLEWNGFTVSGPEGLEAGLIQDYYLPWNMRGA